MKHLGLCYYDVKKFAWLSQSEVEAIGPNCRPHDAALRATGQVLVQGSLFHAERLENDPEGTKLGRDELRESADCRSRQRRSLGGTSSPCSFYLAINT